MAAISFDRIRPGGIRMASSIARPLDVGSTLQTVRRLWLLCAAVSLVALGTAAILAAVDPSDVNWVATPCG